MNSYERLLEMFGPKMIGGVHQSHSGGTAKEDEAMQKKIEQQTRKESLLTKFLATPRGQEKRLRAVLGGRTQSSSERVFKRRGR
tara:strand:- start:111 stop:362 length:252 start_codon:yes stop_codon:yes gene_type:complete